MRYHITGADRQTGEAIELTVEASDEDSAYRKASDRSILVSGCTPMASTQESSVGTYGPNQGGGIAIQSDPEAIWHYVHDKRTTGRGRLTEIAEMVACGKLGPTDIVRPEGKAEWQSVASAAVVQREAAELRPILSRRRHLRLWLVLALTLLVGTGGAGWYFGFYSWFSGRQFLTRELDRWVQGERSEASRAYLAGGANALRPTPLLLEYDIKSFSQVEYSSLGWQEYRAVVNLTLATEAGGRPVEQVVFKVARSVMEKDWHFVSH